MLVNSMIRLLFPSDPIDKKRPEEAYQEEFDEAKALGVACSLFSEEEFKIGRFRPIPEFELGNVVLYRGWMLSPDEFAGLANAITSKSVRPFTTPDQYRLCHHLPGWYNLCKEFTPETIFLERCSDFRKELAGINWPKFFVKDYVKSLTTSRGSTASSVEEVVEIVELIEKYRGQIEGGVCVRKFEELCPETEERYFVFQGRPFAREGAIPGVVKECAKRVDSPFFSVDVVNAADGRLRIMEIGDGQVSDKKKWPAAKLIEMFRDFA